METNISMTREGLRKFAHNILAECDAHSEDQAIEISLEAEHNGSGPALTLVFNNDDMERSGDDALPPETAYWETF